MRTQSDLWNIGWETLKSLEIPEGIMASGRDEIYGCIFGRDSLITDLLLLKAYVRTNDPYLLRLVKKSLLFLTKLQGGRVNRESGEEPGKMIHEFRIENHEHLTKFAPQLWYLYDDGIMRIYDTIDATPLFLMAVHEYYVVSNDNEFLIEMLPSVRAALGWILEYGDSNGDGLIDYQFHPERTHGGLKVQSWMDSTESLFFEDSTELPTYPIAPIEAQAYAYAALAWWGDYFTLVEPLYGDVLTTRAHKLKEVFNNIYIRKDMAGALDFATAVAGGGERITAIRSSFGHCLWAVADSTTGTSQNPRGIIDDKYIPQIVDRLMQPDLFVPSAGIRTLSTESTHFEENSYHNGSIWPHDTGILAEGLERYGYVEEARRVRGALLHTFEHFKTPIELFTYGTGADADFSEYRGPQGQGACRTQAWSAAALLTTVSQLNA